MFNGTRLRELRKQKGFQSADDLAQKANILTSSIYAFENDKREPLLNEFFALSKALEVTIFELLDLSDADLEQLSPFISTDFLKTAVDTAVNPVLNKIIDQYFEKNTDSITFTVFHSFLKSATDSDPIRGAYTLLNQTASAKDFNITIGNWNYTTDDPALKDSIIRLVTLHGLTPWLEEVAAASSTEEE